MPQFHVVDPNSHNSPPVLDNTSFFHDETAENHLPTVPDGSVHEKEFLYTTPQTYVPEVQSRSVVADNHLPITSQYPTTPSRLRPLCSISTTILCRGKIFTQKPMGNILTPFLRITVSTMKDVRHVPQCKTQIKDDKNKSFSLAVMLVLHSIHLSEPL